MEIGKTIKIEKIRDSGTREEKKDIITEELLLNIFVNGQRVSVLSCSPSRIIELVTGYIVSNGYAGDYGDIELIDLCQGEEENEHEDTNKSPGSFLDMMSAKARVSGYDKQDSRGGLVPYLSAGCGNIDPTALPASIQGQISPKGMTVDNKVILELGKSTLGGQKYKNEFGGLHSAALFNTEGEMLSVMEDLGRHNCIDKIYGKMLIDSIVPEDKIIFTSGRASIDLVFKALKMSIPVVVTNSSVTYDAAEIAQEAGLTLIGYARGKRFNIYSHPERIM